MADTEAKKILTGTWADSGDREDPDDAGIDREKGWDVPYEQIGSGAQPERTIFNQKNREWDGCFAEKMRYGGVLPHDTDIDYYQYARCIGSDGMKYVALEATGPANGNATGPTTVGQTIWRLY